MTSRGRRPIQTNEVILDAALASFASLGYDATSVRALNAQLGLSHETISQRFGSKAELFRAAVTHGFEQFVREFDASIAADAPTTDLEHLRAVVRAFIVAASHHPNLGELVNRGVVSESERTHLLAEIGLDARILEIAALLDRLRDAGQVVDVSVRELWFLMQAGAAPLHFRDVAAMFDAIDGELDDARHIDRMAELIMRSMTAPARS